MRRALLVAAREFDENIRTKGFWLGVLLMPMLLVAGFEIPRRLGERGAPTRHFILVDREGSFSGAVDQALERLEQKRLLQALNEYATENVDKEKMRGPTEAVDLERVPAEALNPQAMMDEFNEDNPGALDAFIERGGKDFFLGRIAKSLRGGAPRFEVPRRLYARLDPPAPFAENFPDSEIIQYLKPWLLGERMYETPSGEVPVFAAILIPSSIESFIHRPGDGGAGTPWSRGTAVEFWSANLTDSRLVNEIERSINDEIRRREFAEAGLDDGAVERIQRTRAEIRTLDPAKPEGREEVSVADVIRQWAPSGFVFLLWLAVFMVAQMLLSNTIEEKSNRIIEVLLSSVTPGELMMGKLMGILGVGLVMLAAWVATFLGMLLTRSGSEAEWARELLGVVFSSGLLPWFVVYFLLGYLMYAGIFLSIGSVCNTLKEAQNYMLPLTLILMVPLFTMTFIPRDPNGALATVLSWVPLYSPFVMMNRAAADPPTLDRYGTLTLITVTTVGLLALSGRIFRAGILRTGQPPRLQEMFRWMTGRGE